MDRAEKKKTVEALKGHFNAAAVIVLTKYEGLTVGEITKLRKKANKAGTSFVVTKNKLAKIAAEGTQYEALRDMFVGPTAIAFSSDEVTAAKVIVEFAKDNEKLVILGGAISTQKMSVDGIKALAKLPSLDELRATIVGILNAPAQRTVGVLQAPARQVAGVINAYSKASASE